MGTTSRNAGNTGDGAAWGGEGVSQNTKFIPLCNPNAFARFYTLWRVYIPVPQDSTLVWCPAFSLTAYGCLLFFAMPVCTVLVYH